MVDENRWNIFTPYLFLFAKPLASTIHNDRLMSVRHSRSLEGSSAFFTLRKKSFWLDHSLMAKRYYRRKPGGNLRCLLESNWQHSSHMRLKENQKFTLQSICSFPRLTCTRSISFRGNLRSRSNTDGRWCLGVRLGRQPFHQLLDQLNPIETEQSFIKSTLVNPSTLMHSQVSLIPNCFKLW